MRHNARMPRDPDRRNTIINGATDLFLQHGYDGVSVDDIARRETECIDPVVKVKQHALMRIFEELDAGTSIADVEVLYQEYYALFVAACPRRKIGSSLRSRSMTSL